MQATASVKGISGVFLESKDPRKLADWYAQSFGLQFHYWPERHSYGTEFVYDQGTGRAERKGTVFVIRPGNGHERGAFTVQFQVGDVQAAANALHQTGRHEVSTQEFEYGTFAHLSDPDGNTIELYEPR